jgi:hypothetical protein
METEKPDPPICSECETAIEEQVAYNTEDGNTVHMQCGPDVLTKDFIVPLKNPPERISRRLWAGKTTSNRVLILKADGTVLDRMTEYELNEMLSRLSSCGGVSGARTDR